MSEQAKQLLVSGKPVILGLLYIHVVVWVAVSLLLFGINILTFYVGPWSLIPILSWGIGVIVHGVLTYYLFDLAGIDTKEVLELKDYILNFPAKAKLYVNNLMENHKPIGAKD